MRILSPKTKFIVSASIAAFAAATPLNAQAQTEAETEGADAPEYDDMAIIVRGSIAESQQASVREKRLSDRIVDVAASDSIGRFPDENSAAALSRLPGVAVQRDQGQARYIQVRGAPNRWTSVSIDGIPQIGVDEQGDTRAYRFDAIPAVLLSELQINKSLTPDLTAEAITANINMETFSPLSTKGFVVTGDVGYGFMDLGNGEQRQASLRASWSNDRFGIVIGGSHYKREQVTDNREASYDANGAPQNIDIRNYKLDRSNNGLFGAVEFSPEQGQVFYLKGIYTEFNDDEQRNAYQIELEDAVSGTRGVESGDLVGVPVTGAFNDGKYRNRNYIFSTGVDYEDDDGFGFKAAMGYTRTENTTDLPIVQAGTTGLNSPSLSYDRSKDPRFPIVTLYQTVDNGGTLERGAALDGFDQRTLSVAGSILLPVLQETISDSYTLKLDAYKEYDGFKVQTGLLGAIRDIKGSNIQVTKYKSLAGTGFDINDYVTDNKWDTDFPLGFSLNYVDNPKMNKDLQALLKSIGFDKDDYISPTARYDQTEKNLAGYLMGQAEFGNVLLTGGARLEYYELDNSGFVTGASGVEPLTVNKDYLDIFPSLNARIGLTDDLIFRIAGQRGVSRPAYGAVRIGASIDDVDKKINGGNPNLEPEETWGADASLEYYLPGNGMLSLAAFYRKVDNVLYQGKAPAGTDLYNSGGTDRSDYEFTSSFNGDNGKVYGLELNALHQFTSLPGFLGGFGVQGNLTLLDGSFDSKTVNGVQTRGIEFQGLSDTIVNASVFYEKYGFSGRVSYQWRSKYLDTLGGLGSGEFRDGYDNLDVSLRYAVTDNFTVFADLANLTDAIYTAYEGSPNSPSEVEQIGSRYMFGVRFNFQ